MQTPYSVWVSFRVLIMFKMEIFKEGGAVHRSKIIYPPKNKAKGSYGDCENQVDYVFEENIRLDKIFSKVTRNLTR